MNKTLSISRPANRSGFTLVELLVVIGIIAILAGAVLGASNLALKSAKRAKAQNLASQIQTAALGYFSEYGVYPVPSGTNGDYLLDDTAASATAWGNLIPVLCGNVLPYSPGTTFTPTTITNTHGVAFLSLKNSDVDSNNAPLNPLPTTANKYFNIAMDSDYDGLLGTTGNTQGKLPNFSKSTTTAMDYTGACTAGVAVWENCNGSTTSTNPNWWVHTY